MRILEEVVERYLRDLRPERSEVMREMEELAERDSVPIVHWETGRLLAVRCPASTARSTCSSWTPARGEYAA